MVVPPGEFFIIYFYCGFFPRYFVFAYGIYNYFSIFVNNYIGNFVESVDFF